MMTPQERLTAPLMFTDAVGGVVGLPMSDSQQKPVNIL